MSMKGRPVKTKYRVRGDGSINVVLRLRVCRVSNRPISENFTGSWTFSPSHTVNLKIESFVLTFYSSFSQATTALGSDFTGPHVVHLSPTSLVSLTPHLVSILSRLRHRVPSPSTSFVPFPRRSPLASYLLDECLRSSGMTPSRSRF